jgi:hypothetical protein
MVELQCFLRGLTEDMIMFCELCRGEGKRGERGRKEKRKERKGEWRNNKIKRKKRKGT